MEKFNIKGEKLTTQQRKPHFIKLENNIGGNSPPQSWERLSASGYGENEQVVCAHMPCVCGYTCHFLSFPIYPRRHLQGYPQLFFLHSVACFSFDPGKSRRIFDGGNLASLTTGLWYKSCTFGSWEVVSVCIHQSSQGPWSKPKSQRKMSNL